MRARAAPISAIAALATAIIALPAGRAAEPSPPVAQAPGAQVTAAQAPAPPPTPPAWQGGCAGGACLFRRAAQDGNASLIVARRSGADGLSIGFSFTAASPDRARSVALTLDGQPFATLRPGTDMRPIDGPSDLWLVNAGPLSHLAERLSGGGHLRLSFLDVLGGPHDASFDLGGGGDIVAALAVGDVAKPRTVAPMPRPDLVLPDRLTEIRRLGIPERVAEVHGAMTTCEALDSPRLGGHAPLIVELSPTAVLYALPCAASRDMLLSKLWVLEFGEIGGIAPQSFALYQPRLGWIGGDLLPNVAWDAAADRLTAHAAPAEGCAWSGIWRWRGTVFGLDELTLTACDGRRTTTRIYPTK